MDGDGKGVIAVIRALQDTGLVVTVMGGQCHYIVHPKLQAKEYLTIRKMLGLWCSSYPSHASKSSVHLSYANQAFVSSLRKYPSTFPEHSNRSYSAEMVQRLINYTQTKNAKKRSHHSKSMRYFNNSNLKVDKPKHYRSSKNVQECPRTRNKSSLTDNDHVLNHIEKTRSKNFGLLVDYEKNSRRVNNNEIQETYDYLNYTRQKPYRFNRSAEVRYISDVSRAFRDTLKHICEDRPVVCQKIQNRYINHMRKHHADPQEPDAKSKKAQSPVPSCSNNYYKNSVRTTEDISFISCVCLKTLIDEAINEWVKTIPINYEKITDDKEKHEDLIEKLRQRLKKIVNDDGFDVKAREEIHTCVNNMPMWNSVNQREQDSLKKQIIENLYSNIRNINKIKLIRQTVSNWLQGLQIKERDFGGNVVNKKDVIDYLVYRLKNFYIKNNNTNDVQKTLRNIIQDSIEKLRIVLNGSQNDSVNEITKILTSVLASEEKSNPGEVIIKEELNDVLSTNVQGLPKKWSEKMNSLQCIIDKNKDNEEITTQILEIKSSYKNIQNQIDRIQNLISPETPDNILSKIAQMIVKECKEIRKEEESNTENIKSFIKHTICSEIKRIIQDWGDKIAISENNIDKNKVMEELIKQLVEIKTTNIEIQDAIDRCYKIIPSETVKGIVIKIREMLDSENLNINSIKTDNNKAFSVVLKQFMENWGNELENQQNVINNSYSKERICKQLSEIKLIITKHEEKINQMQSVISSETVERISTKLSENLSKTSVLDEDKKERRTQTEITKDTLFKVTDKAVGTENKAILEDCCTNVTIPKNVFDINFFEDELNKQFSEIKFANTNMEQITDQIKIDNPVEAAEGGTVQTNEILLKEQKENNIKDELHRCHIEINVDKRPKDNKQLFKEWKNNITNLENSTANRRDTDQPIKKLTNIKSMNMIIKYIISQLLRIISNEIVAGEITKLSEVFFREHGQNKKKERIINVETKEDLGEIVETDVKKGIIDCCNDIIKLQNGVEETGIAITLVRHLLQIQSTNSMYIKNMQNAIQSFLKTNSMQQLNEKSNSDLSANFTQQIQKLEQLFNEKACHFSSQNYFNYNRQKSKENMSINKNESCDDTHISHNIVKDKPETRMDTAELKDIDQLVQFLEELQCQGYRYQQVMLSEIVNWLNTLSRNTGIDNGIGDKQTVAKQSLLYIDKNKPRKHWEKPAVKHATFSDEVSNLDNELIQFSNSYENIGKDDKGNISDTTANEFEKNKINSSSEKLTEIIKEQLKEVLTKYRVRDNNANLEDSISEILADQIMRKADLDNTRGTIYSILHKDNISSNEAFDISLKLIESVKSMPLGNKNINSCVAVSKSDDNDNISKFHKEAFKNNVQRIILDFIKEFSSIESFSERSQVKQATLRLVNSVADIISDPQEYTEDILKTYIWEYFNLISLQSQTSVIELGDELVDRILNILINISKPQNHSSQSKSDKKSKNEIAFNTKKLCSCNRNIQEIEYTKTITDIVKDWVENLSLSIDDKLKNDMVRDLVGDILDRQMYFQLIKKCNTSNEKELEHLEYQVFKLLNNLVGCNDIIRVMNKCEDLIVNIRLTKVPVHKNSVGRPHNSNILNDSSIQITEEILDIILKEWFASLPLKKIKTCSEIIDTEILKTRLKCHLEHLRINKDTDGMRNEVKKFLLNCPLDIQNKDDFIEGKINELMEIFVTLPWVDDREINGDRVNCISKDEDDNKNRNALTLCRCGPEQSTPNSPSTRINISLKKTCNILADYILTWFDNLPITPDNMDNTEALKCLKQSSAAKLINKIGEINLNQDILNDDNLYQEILEDEIDCLLDEMSITKQLKSWLRDSKKALIFKILEARGKTKAELAGQSYRRNLKDNISKLLLQQVFTESQDYAELEILKDNLADAYINLRFYGKDNELKERYKSKITNEIEKFCDNYLQGHANMSTNSEKLNLELFNALENVEIPSEKLITKEIELARIRHKIREWLKELQLKSQTNTELLQCYKNIGLLARKLHDIETDNELTLCLVNDKRVKEILRFVLKLPLTVTDELNMKKYIDMLVMNLNNNVDSRHTLEVLKKVTPSFQRKEESEENKNLKENSPQSTRNTHNKVSDPCSSLSASDRAHLEKIRNRTYNAPNLKSVEKEKFVNVSHLPYNITSQSDALPVDLKPCDKSIRHDINLTNSKRQIPYNQEPKFKSKNIHPLSSTISTRHNSIDNIEIGNNQEMKLPSTDQLQISSGSSTSENHNIRTSKSELKKLGPSIHKIPKCLDKMNTSLHDSVDQTLKAGFKNISHKPKTLTGPTLSSTARSTSLNSSPTSPDHNRREVVPQVIIKKYYWDSPNTQNDALVSQRQSSYNSRGNQTQTDQASQCQAVNRQRVSGSCSRHQFSSDCYKIDKRRPVISPSHDFRISGQTQTNRGNVNFRAQSCRRNNCMDGHPDFCIGTDVSIGQKGLQEGRLCSPFTRSVASMCNKTHHGKRCPYPACLYFR